MGNKKDYQKTADMMPGSRLIMLREERKLTPKDLADVIGCSEEAYLDYETGNSPMIAKTLIRLHEFYGVSCDFLLGNTEIRDPYPPKG